MRFIKKLANPDFKNQNALITEKRQYSFFQLDQKSDQLASHFLEILGDDEKIILCFKNQAFHFIASIAALKAGICQIACQAGAPLNKIQTLASDTGASYIFSDFAIHTSVNNIQLDIDTLLKTEKKLPGTTPNLKSKKTTALIVPGSGTTGEAKLLAVDFENLDAIIQRDIKARNLQVGDIHLSLTPIEFYTAKRRSFAYLQSGACIALRENQNFDYFSLINHYHIQHLSMAISHAQEIIQLYDQHKKLIENSFSHIKSVFLGGSPIPEKIRLKLNQITNNNLYIVYGTNELGECCIADYQQQKMFPDCVGKALEGVRLEIIDENQETLARNQVGELRIKTKGRAYIFKPELEQQDKANGNWFYPKDNAFINDEGTLVLQGRCDDAIIFNGAMIYPRQIELLLESYPGIDEVAAFALDINDNQLPAVAFTAGAPMDTNVIKTYLNGELGWFAPKFISQLEQMPKNPAGKILKRSIKDAFMRSLQK